MQSAVGISAVYGGEDVKWSGLQSSALHFFSAWKADFQPNLAATTLPVRAANAMLRRRQPYVFV
jgi:hypothetical protein